MRVYGACVSRLHRRQSPATSGIGSCPPDARGQMLSGPDLMTAGGSLACCGVRPAPPVRVSPANSTDRSDHKLGIVVPQRLHQQSLQCGGITKAKTRNGRAMSWRWNCARLQPTPVSRRHGQLPSKPRQELRSRHRGCQDRKCNSRQVYEPLACVACPDITVLAIFKGLPNGGVKLQFANSERMSPS